MGAPTDAGRRHQPGPAGFLAARFGFAPSSPGRQQVVEAIDFLARQGVEAAQLDSRLGPAEARDVSDQLRTGGLKLLYVASERFSYEGFLGQFGRTNIGLLAADGAHCISEGGRNF